VCPNPVAGAKVASCRHIICSIDNKCLHQLCLGAIGRTHEAGWWYNRQPVRGSPMREKGTGAPIKNLKSKRAGLRPWVWSSPNPPQKLQLNLECPIYTHSDKRLLLPNTYQSVHSLKQSSRRTHDGCNSQRKQPLNRVHGCRGLLQCTGACVHAYAHQCVCMKPQSRFSPCPQAVSHTTACRRQ
jgi:hypothetical protein